MAKYGIIEFFQNAYLRFRKDTKTIDIKAPEALASNPSYTVTLLPSLPTSTQAVTIDASGQLGTAIIPTGNGSSGVTSVGLSLPTIFAISNSPVTSAGTISASLLPQTANRLFASPDGADGTPIFRSLAWRDVLPSLPTSVQAITIDANGQFGTAAIPTNVGAGSVTSIGLDLPQIFQVSNSPITIAGTISASLASQDANTFFASSDGANSVPYFRKIAWGDIKDFAGTSATSFLVGNDPRLHTPNADTGTSQASFQVDSANSGARLKNVGGVLQVRNALDTADAGLKSGSLFVSGLVASTGNQIKITPSASTPEATIRAEFLTGAYIAIASHGPSSNIQLDHGGAGDASAGIFNAGGPLCLQRSVSNKVTYGNVLIGKDVNDGVNRLQVAGSGYFSQDLSVDGLVKFSSTLALKNTSGALQIRNASDTAYADINVGRVHKRSASTEITTSRTLSAADADAELFYSGTDPITLSIDPPSIPVGAEIRISQDGTGAIVLSLLDGAFNNTITTAQTIARYSSVVLKRRSNGLLLLTGDFTAYTPPTQPTADPSLDFTLLQNSQYLALLLHGDFVYYVAPPTPSAPGTDATDFQTAGNSQYVPLLFPN